MRKNRFTKAIVALSLFVVGCGGGTKEALYTKGPMPEGGNFDGVYQSDFGRLELTADGSGRVVGLYEKNDVYGRIEGEVEGNLLYFDWTQWNEEMRGKTRETKGEGVFQYIIEEVPVSKGTKEYHQLKGFWNYGKGALTNPWNAAKLSERAKKRLQPYRPSKGPMEPAEEKNYGGSIGFDESAPSSESGEESAPPAEEETEKEESGGGLDIF